MKNEVTLKEIYERVVKLEGKIEANTTSVRLSRKRFYFLAILIVGVSLFNLVINLYVHYGEIWPGIR